MPFLEQLTVTPENALKKCKNPQKTQPELQALPNTQFTDGFAEFS
jgi:hypothetical protein